jgi:hypothetical protein
MTHFIAQHPVAPNAAQASKIRKALAAIDSDLTLVVYQDPGQPKKRCWIEGPENYGASHMQDKKQEALAAFRAVLPV